MQMASTTFKKPSPNGKITLYLPNRDFTENDSIDGIIMVDANYLNNRKLFCQLIMDFRYGREKDEILGLTFHREFCLGSMQLYPPLETSKFALSKFQEILIQKYRPNEVYPFLLKFLDTAPMSVILQSGDLKDTNQQPCGIHYFVKGFVANDQTENLHRRNVAKLAIYNVPNVAYESLIGQQPYASTNHVFMVCSSGGVELEVTLDKRVYVSGENIPINISINNNSGKLVKKVKVSAYQRVDIMMATKTRYIRSIDKRSTRKGCPIRPGSSVQIVLCVIPTLIGNLTKHGIAVCGNYKQANNYELGPTTTLAGTNDKSLEFGLQVSYFVQVKLICGPLHHITLDVPFVLIKPKSL